MLGARVYSRVGSQEEASIIQNGVLHGGVGEGDVLLGEARVPFSLLKKVPFHYLALRLEPPPQSPSPHGSIPRSCRSGSISSSKLEAGSRRDDDKAVSCNTRWPWECGAVDRNISAAADFKGGADGRTADFGLLGIGVRMIFSKPTMPDIPDASSPSSLTLSASSDCGSGDSPCNGTPAQVGKGAPAGSCVRAGDGILLSVYEAEALVSFSAYAQKFGEARHLFVWYLLHA